MPEFPESRGVSIYGTDTLEPRAEQSCSTLSLRKRTGDGRPHKKDRGKEWQFTELRGQHKSTPEAPQYRIGNASASLLRQTASELRKFRKAP